MVETPSGLDIVTVSQRQGGGAWNLLGTFALEAGTGNRIVLNAAEADGTLVADAVRIVRAVAAGEIAYVHADHLGQPRKLTDATATLLWDRVALPFGATHSEAGLGETSLRFPGQWADAESGLHYNYFRDYDPSLGRYIESDPIGLAGGLNTYGYVGGNPINDFDPEGLARQRGERGATGGASGKGTRKPYKKCRELDPPDPKRVICRDHQTGKWVVVARPPEMPYPGDRSKSEICDENCQQTTVLVIGSAGAVKWTPSVGPPGSVS